MFSCFFAVAAGFIPTLTVENIRGAAVSNPMGPNNSNIDLEQDKLHSPSSKANTEADTSITDLNITAIQGLEVTTMERDLNIGSVEKFIDTIASSNPEETSPPKSRSPEEVCRDTMEVDNSPSPTEAVKDPGDDAEEAPPMKRPRTETPTKGRTSKQSLYLKGREGGCQHPIDMTLACSRVYRSHVNEYGFKKRREVDWEGLLKVVFNIL